MSLLLLSNSTMVDEPFFQWTKPYIKEFLSSSKKNLVFIPFAAVTFSYDEYFEKVKVEFESMGHRLTPIHHSDNKRNLINYADGIVVGGGNTFQLLKEIYNHDLLDVIRNNVLSGGCYIGWSAGANLSCPTIGTTNDMPIVQPPSFNALNLVSFQINPHFTEATIPNHGGESRSLRIQEYLEVNRDKTVIGLPEGNLIEVIGNMAIVKGKNKAKLFQYAKEPVEVKPGENITQFLNLQ